MRYIFKGFVCFCCDAMSQNDVLVFICDATNRDVPFFLASYCPSSGARNNAETSFKGRYTRKIGRGTMLNAGRYSTLTP